MALILALWPVPLLAVTATVELHSGGQARLPDCLAVMLLGELYLALSRLEGLRCSSKCCSTAFSERESPHGFWTVPLNDAPQGNSMTNLIYCSRAKSPVVWARTEVYLKSFIFVQCRWRTCGQLPKFVTPLISELYSSLADISPGTVSLMVSAVFCYWLTSLEN